MLAGIAVNNSIILVDRINQLIKGRNGTARSHTAGRATAHKANNNDQPYHRTGIAAAYNSDLVKVHHCARLWHLAVIGGLVNLNAAHTCRYSLCIRHSGQDKNYVCKEIT
jgi:hypothetical protein